MTPPSANDEEILRRMLRAAVEPVDPAGDGLGKIQRHLAESWLRREAWHLRQSAGAFGWLIRVRAEDLAGRVRMLSAARGHAAARRALPAAPGGPGSRARALRRARPRRRAPAHAGRTSLAAQVARLASGAAGLRSAVAVAGAVVVVVAGVYALGELHQAVVPASQFTRGSYIPTPGHPAPAAGRHSPSARPERSSSSRSRRRRGDIAAPTCSPSPSPSPSAAANPAPNGATPGSTPAGALSIPGQGASAGSSASRSGGNRRPCAPSASTQPRSQ